MEKFNNARLPILLTLLFLVMSLMLPANLLAAEPKPGEVINAGNVDQYEEYFPSFMVKFIKGTDFAAPVVITMRETEYYSMPDGYMEWTEKNRGQLKIDSEGNIQGNYRAGQPFPDPKEPNLAQKLMWNFYYRWRSDQWTYMQPGWISYGQRKGGRITSTGGLQFYMYFTNRTSLPPLPERPNPHGLFFGFIQHIGTGISKDMDFLIWRYTDPKKSDEMWTYVPTLRRTIRMVSSERSNPVRGSAATYDDYYGFDGKIHEFTYKNLGQKRIVALMHQNTTALTRPELFNGWPHPILFGEDDPYEVWDHYLLEIKAKNPRYPESKRLLWVTDKIFMASYAETYDKRGEFWKGLYQSYSPTATCMDEWGPWMQSQGYSDFKTSYWTGVIRRGACQANCPFDPYVLEPGVLGSDLPIPTENGVKLTY